MHQNETQRLLEDASGHSYEGFRDRSLPSEPTEVSCWHPDSLCHRITALVLMCALSFGSYFCFDNPGALQNEMKEALNINTFQFASFYAWYSWPNVLLPAVGGFVVDRYLGVRLGAVIFCLFLLLGQLLFAMGAFVDNFLLMEAARFVFGIGGESLSVVQNIYASLWFTGRGLNMVFGLQLSMGRVGSSINFLTVEPLFRTLAARFSTLELHTILGWTLTIAGFTLIASTISAVVLGLLDRRAARMASSVGHLHEHDRNSNEDEIHIEDIVSFPLTFWLLCIICVAFYVTIFPFVSLGQVYFIKKYDFSSNNANFITGLIYLISAFASPLCGAIVDRIGRNISFVALGCALAMGCHMILTVTIVINPYFPVIGLGLGYSILASALWPMTSLIIPKHQLGTAYGVMQAIQNFGLASISLLAGFIVDNFGYMWVEVFYDCCLLVTLVAVGLLWTVDRLAGPKQYLDLSTKVRNQRNIQLESEQY